MLVTHALQTEKKMLHNEILSENHSNVPSRRSDKQVSKSPEKAGQV